MLQNPLQEPVTFQVFFTGSGLLGDNVFSIGPKTSSTYELLYSPLKTTSPGMPEKGTIGFLNEKLGEFWYDLILTCDENPIHTVPAVECELGKRKELFVDLENPINDEVIIEHTCSNSTNFQIFPEKILIGPYDQFKVCVQYSPSTLNELQTGQIQFKNQSIGKWRYRVQGRGLYPTIMEPQPVSTAVGTNTSSMLAFKNPFRQPSMVDVQLDTMEQNGIFQLLLKKNRFSIPPLGILQIPYSFSPQSMTQSSAVIIVKMSSQLIWKYPIRGIAELASTQIDFMFKAKSRQTFSKELEVVLPHIEAAQLSQGQTFHHQLKVINDTQEGFIKRTVLLDLPNKKLEGKSLNFFLRFQPLRPFKANCELLVYKSSGGRWKFNCIFQATQPQIDDVINLKSPLQKTSSVSFKLTNHLRAPAEFEAHMTAQSANEFMVYPTSGVLPPFGKDGTSFIVSFTPVEYGKPKVAKLVITTEEMQWSYELRGSHPHYKIPDIGAGRLNNKLPSNIIEVMQKKQQEKKNFMKANMISAAYQSPGKSKIQTHFINLKILDSALGETQGVGQQSALSFGLGGK